LLKTRRGDSHPLNTDEGRLNKEVIGFIGSRNSFFSSLTALQQEDDRARGSDAQRVRERYKSIGGSDG
jgi:hypothetical protein